MNFERYQAVLDQIRRRQGTDRPLVQVVAGATVVRGRVARSASGRSNPNSPYAVLVLEQPGLTRIPASFVQIASIPDDGLSGIESP
jgi:hypothetical protein